MRFRRDITFWLGLIAASWVLGCGSESGTEDENDDTGDPSDNTGGDDTAANEGGVSEACQSFYDFAEQTCEMSQIELVVAQAFCNTFDQVFIDSFMEDLGECLETKGCDELAAVMDLAGSGEGLDTDTPNVFEECTAAAAMTAEPEPANETFRTHFCDYVIQCDPEVTSMTECEAAFETEDMRMFLVIDEPYIGQADDCVDPMPTCGDATVETCLSEAGNSIVETLTAGLGK